MRSAARRRNARGATASDVLVRVAATWEPLWAAGTAHEDALDEQTPAGWSRKQILAPIAFWDEAVVSVVMTLVRGLSLPSSWGFGNGGLGLSAGSWPPADVHDARARRRGLVAPRCRGFERCDHAHRQLVTLLLTVTDQEVSNQEVSNHRDYFGSLGTHYQEHLASVTSV